MQNAGATARRADPAARESDYRIEAEARATGEQIVTVRHYGDVVWRAARFPKRIVRYVMRTRESVILDDAANSDLFSADDYLRDRQSKSILCLPLIKQREIDRDSLSSKTR